MKREILAICFLIPLVVGCIAEKPPGATTPTLTPTPTPSPQKVATPMYAPETEETKLRKFLDSVGVSPDFVVEKVDNGKFTNWQTYAYAFLVTKNATKEEAFEALFRAFYYLGYKYPNVDIIGVQITSKTSSFRYPEYAWSTDTLAISVQNRYMQAYLKDEINFTEFMAKCTYEYTKLGYL
jgi:hypothetical protein